MRIPDANVLLYAVDRAAPRHDSATEWVERSLSGSEAVGLAWVVLLAFIRLSTSPAVFTDPLGPGDALDFLEEWLAQPATVAIEPTERHTGVLRSLLEDAGTAGNLTTDAHLASIAIEHGATLSTFDADFHRFSGLKLEHLR